MTRVRARASAGFKKCARITVPHAAHRAWTSRAVPRVDVSRVMPSVRERAAAFARGDVEDARRMMDARASSPEDAVERRTRAAPSSAIDARVAVDSDARARARAEASDAVDAVDAVEATARRRGRDALERAGDALALARAIEATVRREGSRSAFLRLAKDAEDRARSRTAAAERAFEALARTRAPGGDDEGRVGATTRDVGTRATTSSGTGRSFTFARVESDGSDDDVGGEDEAARSEDEPSLSSDDDDLDDVSDAIRDIDAARKEIARIARAAAARRLARAAVRERDARETRTDRASADRRVVVDRIAAIDGILAALAE